MCVGACRTFLCCSWSQTISLSSTWSQTSLTSFVIFLSIISRWSLKIIIQYFSSSQYLNLWLICLKLIVLIIKCSSSYRTSWLEKSKLLLVKNLRICKTLICWNIAQIRRSHNLLRHHKIISLRSINAFLTLNSSDSKRLLNSSNWYLSNRTNSTDCHWHIWRLLNSLGCKLFETSWPILIFIWNFRTISFESNHLSIHSNYSILINQLILNSLWTLSISNIIYINNLTILSRVNNLIILSLVSQSPDHHIRRLMMRWLPNLRN